MSIVATENKETIPNFSELRNKSNYLSHPDWDREKGEREREKKKERERKRKRWR